MTTIHHPDAECAKGKAPKKWGNGNFQLFQFRKIKIKEDNNPADHSEKKYKIKIKEDNDIAESYVDDSEKIIKR